MSQTDISFKTSDGVTLRGWFIVPENPNQSAQLPCLVLVHGWSCIKEMALPDIAARLTSALPMNCLIYDQRGFGSSDSFPDQPRQEIIPATQCSDMRDAITYVQTRQDVDKLRIGLWGFSYSGGFALFLAAVDRRIKAVISLAPFVDG